MAGLTLLTLLFTLLNGKAAECERGERQSVDFDAVYTADVFANASGGEARRAAYLDNLDLTLLVDGGVFHWPGACVFVYGLYNNGARFSDGIVGDAQVVSNIETDVMALRLYEAWIDGRFWNDSLSLRLGLYDLNAEFDAVEAAGLFVNSAHGIGTDFGQSGKNGPSIFPVTSLALRGEVASVRWRLRAAVMDAVPGDPRHPARTAIKLGDGTLSVGEVDYTNAALRTGFGYWRYSDPFVDLATGTPHRGNHGWYGFVESAVASDRPGLSLFGRIGRADEAFNQFEDYFGAGVLYRGAFCRPHDAVGIAIAWAQTGGTWREAMQGEGREINLELTWQVQLNNIVSLQPDLQYVIDPGADPRLDNALVVGIRATFLLQGPGD